MQPQQPGEKVQAISKQDARPRQEDQQKAEMVQLALDMTRQMQKPVSAHQQPQKEKSDAHGIQQLKHRRDIQSEMPCAMPTVQPQQQPGLKAQAILSTAQQIQQQKQRPDIQSGIPCAVPTMQPQQQRQLPGPKAQAILQQDARPRQQDQQNAEMVHQALDMTRQIRKPILADQQLPKETSNAQQTQHLQQLPQILFETPSAMPTIQPQQQPGPETQAILQQDARPRQQDQQNAEMVHQALDMTRQIRKPILAHQQLQKEKSDAHEIEQLKHRQDIQSGMPRAMPTMQPQQHPGLKPQAILQQDARPRQQEQQKAEIVHNALDMTRRMRKPIPAQKIRCARNRAAETPPGYPQDARPRQQEQQKAEMVHQALDMTRQTQKPFSAHKQLPHETSPAQPIQHLQQLLQILSETPRAIPTMQPQQQPGPKAQAICKQDARPQQQDQQKAEMVHQALDMTRQTQKPFSAHKQLPHETSPAQPIQHLQQLLQILSETPRAIPTMQPQQQPGPETQAILQQDARPRQQEQQKAEMVHQALDMTRQMQKPVSAHQQLQKEKSDAHEIEQLKHRRDIQSGMPCAMPTVQPQQQPGPETQAILQQDARPRQQEQQKAEMVHQALDMTRRMRKPIPAHQQLPKETSNAQQIKHLQQRPQISSETPCAMPTIQPQQQPQPHVSKEPFISQQDPRRRQQEARKAEVVQLALDMTRQKRQRPQISSETPCAMPTVQPQQQPGPPEGYPVWNAMCYADRATSAAAWTTRRISSLECHVLCRPCNLSSSLDHQKDIQSGMPCAMPTVQPQQQPGPPEGYPVWNAMCYADRATSAAAWTTRRISSLECHVLCRPCNLSSSLDHQKDIQSGMPCAMPTVQPQQQPGPPEGYPVWNAMCYADRATSAAAWTTRRISSLECHVLCRPCNLSSSLDHQKDIQSGMPCAMPTVQPQQQPGPPEGYPVWNAMCYADRATSAAAWTTRRISSLECHVLCRPCNLSSSLDHQKDIQSGMPCAMPTVQPQQQPGPPEGYPVWNAMCYADRATSAAAWTTRRISSLECHVLCRPCNLSSSLDHQKDIQSGMPCAMPTVQPQQQPGPPEGYPVWNAMCYADRATSAAAWTTRRISSLECHVLCRPCNLSSSLDHQKDIQSGMPCAMPTVQPQQQPGPPEGYPVWNAMCYADRATSAAAWTTRRISSLECHVLCRPCNLSSSLDHQKDIQSGMPCAMPTVQPQQQPGPPEGYPVWNAMCYADRATSAAAWTTRRISSLECHVLCRPCNLSSSLDHQKDIQSGMPCAMPTVQPQQQPGPPEGYPVWNAMCYADRATSAAAWTTRRISSLECHVLCRPCNLSSSLDHQKDIQSGMPCAMPTVQPQQQPGPPEGYPVWNAMCYADRATSAAAWTTRRISSLECHVLCRPCNLSSSLDHQKDIQSGMPCAMPTVQPQQQPGPPEGYPVWNAMCYADRATSAAAWTTRRISSLECHVLCRPCNLSSSLDHQKDIQSGMPCAMPTVQPQQQPGPPEGYPVWNAMCYADRATSAAAWTTRRISSLECHVLCRPCNLSSSLDHQKDIQSGMPCAMPTVQPQQQPGPPEGYPVWNAMCYADRATSAAAWTTRRISSLECHVLCRPCNLSSSLDHQKDIQSGMPCAMPTVQPQQQPGPPEGYPEASNSEVVQLALDMTRQTQKRFSAHQQLPHETSPAQPIQHLQQLPQILSETPRAIPTMQPQQQPGPKAQAICKQDARPQQQDQQKAEMVQLALDMTRHMQKPVSGHQQLAKEASTEQQIQQQKQRPDIQSGMPCAVPTMQPQQQRQLPGPKAQAILQQDARPRQQEQQKAEISCLGQRSRSSPRKISVGGNRKQARQKWCS
ncbi:hypothetical protein Tcan_07408 [Toxocara canis]|uniref:Uncharacterized protein n=1 Tax=Toxocara canis TaxID=6265 RepID=A0A0B2W413_TOXCA|nr:hypothetical protein Tcan_07408 [Toxocara canis]